ncbi:MAG: hypothetical protein Q9182_003844 [Xanthomendoza sp. 2 TL-2023]
MIYDHSNTALQFRLKITIPTHGKDAAKMMFPTTFLSIPLLLLLLPFTQADFYVIDGELSSIGNRWTVAPISAPLSSTAGIVPVGKISCGQVKSFDGDEFDQNAATNTIKDTNCNADGVTFTGTGGGNWKVSNGGKDAGTCVRDTSQGGACLQSPWVNLAWTSLLKCTSGICA